jgi:putative ABC transport system ATP-binding protein
MHHVLQLDTISKAYLEGSARRPVLNALSIQIESGELTLICGPSGCGKSTLLAIASGLLQPDAGSVTALGEDLWHKGLSAIEHFRLQYTGFVFQHCNLFPALRSWEQVALPLHYLGMDAAAARERAESVLRDVGLGERLQDRPRELSGGEQQRVAIARALAKNPRLIFADEPTSALDAASGAIVIDTLRQRARDTDAIVLCVSHDGRLIAHADRVLMIDDGRITSDRRAA